MVQTLVGRLSQLLITDPVFGELCDTVSECVVSVAVTEELCRETAGLSRLYSLDYFAP